jgi:membrane fusion protein, multidrug efflux system
LIVVATSGARKGPPPSYACLKGPSAKLFIIRFFRRSQNAPAQRTPRRRRWIILLLCLGTVVYFESDRVFVYTDDAYVQSDFVPVAPEVNGIVRSVDVTDNQPVKVGDRLLQLDPEPFRLSLALKQEQVAAAIADMEEKTAAATVIVSQIDSANAALQFAQQNYDRIKSLVADQTVSKEQFDSATDNLRQAQERLAQASAQAGVAARQVDIAKVAVEAAKAEQAIAAYDLSRTEVKAPVDGYVTNLTLRPGVYARVGSPLIGLVDANRFRITANFKEYVASGLKPGTTVWIWLDSHPWRVVRGRVESVGRGIARNDTPGLLLPYVAPTTNWIRLQRRLPVTIAFDRSLPWNDLYMGADARVLIFQ